MRKVEKILSVEDNDDHYEIIRYNLLKADPDLKIDRCADGLEAINFFKSLSENPPNLVLLDLNLPKYSGLEVLETIKAHEQWGKIPIVMFTTSNSSRDVDKVLSKGVNSYIAKPTDPKEMKTILADILNYWRRDEAISFVSHG